ncbi:glycosyltransferase [Microbacterium bovistercoris]|uniref:Glycosyltransferase n=1 Tax=Microbacterium bovistercoris TaxID=2293570 RepID=A0A371NXQ7_9MICO|nr:glycosyltransferase [Microbacterium bovistercoris]REJ07596.1 glycosyltransferase [Microbacterium bovistercoris]
MSVLLRVVLDQLVTVVDPDQAAASLDLTAGLVRTAPRGCGVAAIAPAGAEVPIAGIEEVRTLAVGRRELAASWPLGFAPGVGGGLVHAPTLMAPLVRHDRVHDGDQTIVTLWDLGAWDAPEQYSKTSVAWQRGMLRRAVKHADAVVVPSHAMARRLADLGSFGDRIRVIAGAAPEGFAEPADAAARRAALLVPERYAVIVGGVDALAAGFTAAIAAGLDVVVLDAADGSEPAIVEIASAAGMPERRVHVRGVLDASDRAAVLGAAAVVLAVSALDSWPWRVVEAMLLGVPVVAVDSGVHRDVIADGGLVVSPADLADAAVAATGGEEKKLRVLAHDRAKAFSWASSAERVWALHAEL